MPPPHTSSRQSTSSSISNSAVEVPAADEKIDEKYSPRVNDPVNGSIAKELVVDQSAAPVDPVEPVIAAAGPPPVPDGGLQAWLQVIGSFFLFFNSWGVVNTFGSYQAYYEIELLPNSNPSAISWIGSIQAFLLLGGSVLIGPLYDAGYFRALLIGGSFMLVFGQMMISLCTEYWQVLLAQAFCIGIGCGCIFVPSVAIMSAYFRRRIATATGIAASGSSLGGVIYPIMFHKLQPQIGFQWTTRIIGFVMLATLLIPILVMRVRILPSSRRKIFDIAAFREVPYSLFVVGGFFGFMGLYTPFFFVQLFGIQNGIVSQDFAFYLLSIMNSSSIFGRIVPNVIADKAGPLNIIIPCSIMTGILMFCLISISSLGSLVVFCLLYGFFSGTFVSLPPTVLVALSPNLGVVGTRMGMCFAVTGVGVLIGNPIAGAILDSKGFNSVWIFGGVTAIAGGVFMTVSRGVHVGWKLNAKS